MIKPILLEWVFYFFNLPFTKAIIKIKTERKILAMDGFGGQQIIIDFDKERIIVVNSRDRHYNWKKIVHKKLKQK